MPSHQAMRSAIRSTWLNRQNWEFDSGIQVHTIFLLGQEKPDLTGIEVKREAEKFNDILQSDFKESHYNLAIKDHDFFNFIVEQCPEIDFAVKGDDDILIVPQNLAYMIDGLKTSRVSFEKCVAISRTGIF